jgi:hypothetical protein
VLSTTARKVTIELHLPAGVEARLLNTFETDRLGAEMRVRLDDMIAGESRSSVFKLTVPPGHLGTTIPLRVTASYTDVETGETRTVTTNEAVLTYATAAECSADTPNPSVMEEVAMQEAARAREEALKYDAAGDHARTAQVLAGAAQFMMQAAPGSPVAQAEAFALRDESQEAERGFSAIKRKAIHYAKTATQQSRKK